MVDQINVNQLADALNNKIDLPIGKNQTDVDYVVASQLPTSSNNYTWYRLYKSGWVEQGGIGGTGASTSPVVVTLPVTMADGYYSIMATFNGSSYREQAISAIRTSTTQISLYHNANSNYIFWIVSGMSAQGGS